MNIFPGGKSFGINKIIEEYYYIALPFEKELYYWFRFIPSLDSYWFYDRRTVLINDRSKLQERWIINRADESKYLYFAIYNTSFWEE